MARTRGKAAAGTMAAGTAVATAIMVAGAVVSGTAACSSGPPPPTGTVQGLLEVYPGPAPPADSIPASGQATFTDASGHSVTVAVPDTGKFTVRLPAGTYTAVLAPANFSPGVQTIHVQADRTVKIVVDCTWDTFQC